ncbi:TonB-linked SusC/RagA family outer membrane protein [Cellulophaga sp. RHA19]|uniref:SusC/RagA family TonB-linked outer membrane protein n=1 Tax=Cellulophaga sp. RHA19 TaxID=1798237 RepID=UPI000C2C2505|nr:SusC/RagA family TonB-linked outer membrane protein [Cellulophaga sp. RHA19]PKB43302.1 TonB-linked SusC/RagA family outer membrane protein [Cellulophaga sp. RHA19]
MRTKVAWILTPLLVLLMSFSYGQEKTITGNVTDQDGLPLPGVSVLVVGTTTGTQTDFDGNYTIKASVGQVLRYSYVGQKTADRKVGSSSTVNVQLAEDAEALEEVIVLGYSTKSVDEVTGSSVQVSSEDIKDVPVLSVDQALQGKVAGLQISTTSGTPGAQQDIRIRGVGSINASNSPLYVIDGVPVVSENFSGSANRTSLSSLVSLNSKDIESMTVLKDASATAAYGARGSNGVIVITTKRGKSGKAVFNFSSVLGFQNNAYNKRSPLTASQRATLIDEATFNAYGEGFDFERDEARDFAVANNLGNIANWDGSEYDWPGLMENKDALIQDYNFSASGGTEKTNYYASLGFNETEPTVIGDSFRRISGKLSFQTWLRDNVKLDNSINVSNSRQNPVLENGAFFNNPHLTRYYMTPFANPYNADGTYNINNLGTSVFNTLYTNENDEVYNKYTRATTNTKLDWELIENLTFSSRIGLDFSLSEYKAYNNRYHGDSDGDVNGSSTASDEKNYNWVSQNSLNYQFKLGSKHNFDVTALFEYQKNNYTYLYAYGENFSTDGLTNIASAGSNFDASSSFTDWTNISYLGMLNYNFDGRYILDATFRREGSSRFANGHRYGNFGSVGLGWNVHREDFLEGSVFNELRLRGSWGITGNSGIATNTYQAFLAYDADYAGNGAVYPSQLGNEFLSWENGETVDAGFDFGVFDNRLSGSFAYFNKRTYDLLQDVPLSPTTGFASQNTNIGEVVNKGIEAQLNYDIFRSEDFNWSISGNFATVDNEVTKLALDSTGEEINPSATSTYKTTEVGLPIGAWFMRTWAGVDTETGEPTWYVNGVDGEVTSNYASAARVNQDEASALPTFSGGFSTHIEYKGIFMDASLYYAGGHKVYEQYAQHYFRTNSFTLGSYNGVEELLERWQQPGDVTDVPKLVYNGADNFHATSSRHLYDGDYIRLKDLTFGYNLPAKFTEDIGLDAISFTVKGTNLYTWVKDDGLKLDPEVGAAGYTGLVTPPVKSVVFGVNVKF